MLKEILNVIDVYPSPHDCRAGAVPPPMFSVGDTPKVAIERGLMEIELSLINLPSGIFEGKVIISPDSAYLPGEWVWFKLPQR
jgi:hypothetical protein